MSRRVYSSRVKKWAIGAGITGVPLAVLLIWFLTTLGVVAVTGFSGDTICAGTELDPCLAYINLTVNEDIFIYPSENWSATPFYTDIQPKSVKMYRSWGSSWREIKLNQSCKGTWCGLSNSKDTRKFSFAFREGRDYRIKYEVLKNDPKDDIKWGFDKIDPLFLGLTETNVFTKLISNKADLTGGEAIFEIDSPYVLNLSDDLSFSFYEKSGSSINSFDVFLEVKEPYLEGVVELVFETKECDVNGTLQNCTTSKWVTTGYVNKTRIIWKPINIIEKGKHKIKIIAYWNAHLGPQEIDWIPSINFPKEISGLEEDLVITKNAWAWWNNDWSRKKQINITENTGVDLNNYQVRLNISSESEMNANYSDLRFPNNTEASVLDFFLWNYTSDYVYVDVNLNLTGGVNNTIFMYYGNTITTSTSNGTDTYINFTDFDSYTVGGGLPTGWIDRQGNGRINIDNTTSDAYDNKFIFLDDNSGSTSFAVGRSVAATVNQGKYMFWYKRIVGSTSQRFALWNQIALGSVSTTCKSTFLNQVATWEEAQIQFNSSDVVRSVLGYTESAFSSFDTAGECGSYSFEGITSDIANYSYDYFAFANWTFPEPTVTIYAEELDVKDINNSLEGFLSNITSELGSTINVTSNITEGTVCIDIDHPEYGINYSCGTFNTTFNFNISYFRTIIFNDSNTARQLNYSSNDNQTIYIDSHQYDEITNLTINLTGDTNAGNYPENVSIWINDTLSNSIGSLRNPLVNATLTKLSNGESNYNVTFTSPGTQTVWLSVPGEANTSSAFINITGHKSTGIFNFTYDDLADNLVNWSIFDNSTSHEVQITFPESSNTVQVVLNPTSTFDSLSATLFTTGLPANEQLINITFTGALNPANPDGPLTSSAFISAFGNTLISRIQGETLSTTTFLLERNITTGNFEVYLGGVWNKTIAPTDDEIKISASVNVGPPNWLGPASSTLGTITYWKSLYPSQPFLEVGVADGDYEWNSTNVEYSIEETTGDFNDALEGYLAGCTLDANLFCDVPLNFFSSASGQLQVSAIKVNYTLDVNPVALDLNVLRNFLGNSSSATEIPINISSTQGNITINDLRFDYAGGNKSYDVYSHSDNYLLNLTRNVLFYYSDFHKNLPYTWTDQIFFLPRSNNSKNVTAYGQTDSIPLFNITTTNHGAMNLNLSLKLNESFSCLNLTWNATGNIKSADQKVNTSWQEIASNLEYLNNTRIWFWADLNQCDASDRRILNPEIYLESYCKECIWN